MNRFAINNFLRYLKRFSVGFFVVWQILSPSPFSMIFLSSGTALAASPTTVGYQGRLMNAGGTALTGSYNFTFRLFSALSGGSLLWTETQNNIPVDQSYFTAQLGSVTAFPTALDFNQPLWLTTEVNSDGEMSPRVPLNSVPYAYTAGGVNSYASAPSSATGGRIYYDNSNGTLNYYDGVSSVWKTLSSGGAASTTAGYFFSMTTSTFDGNLSYAGKTGYAAANAICQASASLSHVCTPDEMLMWIAVKNFSATTGTAWIANGPPGYLANANDCAGFTTNAVTALGAFWIFSTSTGGQGFLVNCSNLKPLACCKNY